MVHKNKARGLVAYQYDGTVSALHPVQIKTPEVGYVCDITIEKLLLNGVSSPSCNSWSIIVSQWPL